MNLFISLMQAVCILIAATILGTWFLNENKKLKAAGKPWFATYLTIPGIMVMIIILVLPFLTFLKQ